MAPWLSSCTITSSESNTFTATAILPELLLRQGPHLTSLSLWTLFIIYSLSSLLSIWMSLLSIPGQWLASILLSLCFPTVSPFVLICSAIHIFHNIFASSSRQGKHFLLIWRWPLDSILYKISNYFPLTINIWLTNIFQILDMKANSVLMRTTRS